MIIEQIELRNIGGLEHFEVKTGRLTIIKGRNASGKTSLIRGILAALRGGSANGILRAGQDRGHVTLKLSNGGRIRRGFTEHGAKLSGKVDGEEIKQGRLDRLCNAESLDPISFMKARDAERLELLLRVCPIALDDGRMKDIFEQAYGTDHHRDLPDSGADAIRTIDTQHKLFYEERRGFNAAAKASTAAAESIESSIPEGDAEAVSAELKTKRAAVEKLRVDIQKKTTDALKESVDREAAEVDRIRVAAVKERDDIRKATNATVEQAHTAETEVARLDEQHKTFERSSLARQNVRGQKRLAAEAYASAERLTKALTGLTRLRVDLLKELPIPDMELRDGKIFVKDVAFDDLNEAQRLMISLELAVMAASELGLVVVDGIERLDSANREHMIEAITGLDTKLAFILTEVSDDAELTVEHVEVKRA